MHKTSHNMKDSLVSECSAPPGVRLLFIRCHSCLAISQHIFGSFSPSLQKKKRCVFHCDFPPKPFLFISSNGHSVLELDLNFL